MGNSRRNGLPFLVKPIDQMVARVISAVMTQLLRFGAMDYPETAERLSDLLADPREDLDREIKNWLDLRDSKEDRANFAKAALALANHGGGFIVLGFSAIDGRFVEAEGRPPTLDGYNQDLVNGIVESYSDPAFHCSVKFVSSREGLVYPVVRVPGGHRVPVRAKRSGPHGNTISNLAIYIRKPGPRSEVPQTAQDWDALLARCLQNRRDEMFDQLRALLAGNVPPVEASSEPEKLASWTSSSITRWRHLTSKLPEGAGARLPKGHFWFAYEISGERKNISLSQLPQIIGDSVVQHTGWPPFWVPTRKGIAPYAYDGAVECWIGGDPETPPDARDPGHADFWRVHPEGLAFLIRGYQEDGLSGENSKHPIAPGSVFDVTLPVWRVGETLLQAERLATKLFDPPSTIRFRATYEGLEDRELTSVSGRRMVRDGRVARQSSISLNTHVDVRAIGPNLPEIVHPVLKPLYALFDFFDLPFSLVAEELERMRSNRI